MFGVVCSKGLPNADDGSHSLSLFSLSHAATRDHPPVAIAVTALHAPPPGNSSRRTTERVYRIARRLLQVVVGNFGIRHHPFPPTVTLRYTPITAAGVKVIYTNVGIQFMSIFTKLTARRGGMRVLGERLEEELTKPIRSTLHEFE